MDRHALLMARWSSVVDWQSLSRDASGGALASLRDLPRPVRTLVLRTWMHGWFSTKRMHEAVRHPL